MIEIRHIDRRPPATSVKDVLHRKGVPYSITGELTIMGIADDYWNTPFTVSMCNDVARDGFSEEKIDRLRKALATSRTYTQYIHDRFLSTPSQNLLQKRRHQLILDALTNLPEAKKLNTIAKTFHEMAKGDISQGTFQEINALTTKAYIAVYGEERAKLAGVIK